jgi:hypothetical protein
MVMELPALPVYFASAWHISIGNAKNLNSKLAHA